MFRFMFLMMTSSNGNIFRVTGHLCGDFTGPRWIGTGEFPAQRPVTRSFDVFFDLQPNKRLSKQWWGWSFQTASCPLWRHRNVTDSCCVHLIWWRGIFYWFLPLFVSLYIIQVLPHIFPLNFPSFEMSLEVTDPERSMAIEVTVHHQQINQKCYGIQSAGIVV